jgi:allene oxide cyclase
MHPYRFVAMCTAGALVLGAAVVAQASDTTDSDDTTRVHVIEHALTDAVADVGVSGDSAGDLLTFKNPVFNADNSQRVGGDQGSCIRISPQSGTWQCSFTTLLKDGQITVEGPFYDARDSVLAITGGTRAYKTAHGAMSLLHREDPSEFDFVFRIIL